MSEKRQQASRRKYHYVYKTTCIPTGRWYIGIHSTDDLQDGYRGSGTDLAKSIREYGREKHLCEILEFCETRDEAKKLEAELVTWHEVWLDECMNLIPGGGDNGWDCINYHPEGWKGFGNWKRSDVQAKISALYIQKRIDNPEFAKLHDQNVSNGLKLHYAENGSHWSGKKHSDDARQKMSAAKIGKYNGTANSSAGRPWVYHIELQECRKIPGDQLEAYLAQGWIKGRKIKFSGAS